MALIDTHAHLDQDEFAEDQVEVIQRATAAGVEKIVAVGVGVESSRRSIRLAAQYPAVYAAVGIQPNYCAEAQPGDWDQIVRWVQQPKVVGIGETGLDRHWDYTPFDLQQDYFDRHLRLSQARGLPFIVHTRDSEADVVAMLREARQRGPLCGVMHSFVGEAAVAAECLEMGLYISFAGMVTFKKSDALRAVAATIPDDRILVETDAPYLSPAPRRGRRNEPAHLVHTARLLAEVRQQDFDHFARLTTDNACRLFPFSGVEFATGYVIG
ncbi:MAG: YchF/TatD family DNA exonuclease [Planctomycetales bacterium]|nr:YchF/TatD family DNA exonuclease [Planctomycetales bacterium]NIM09412.1 YchF/TatD family DNA exonuclease [Planctomycetales bacterium]NIN08890.1 YchF/TatD family DNA exonuclease [Planctomycetales bacterium]NIN78005.1 YchF/TatD family DNA exonuclease [Planctomycetales bacterium]NIO35193.1 YchF/TatD family DNA exonuclease [Planctomycetales bacterium]